MKTNRILVIDDNINATRVARLILERTGHYAVRELNDPGQALDIAREFEPDLILLDVCMPDIEGSAVAEKINGTSEFADTPIVFLTAYAYQDDIQKGLESGAQAYLTKPFDFDVLEQTIEQFVL